MFLALAGCVVLVAAGVIIIRLGRQGGTASRVGGPGLRTSATMLSDEAWSAGQRAGAPLVTAAGAGLILAGALCLIVRFENVVWAIGGGAAWALVAFGVAMARAHRAAQAAHEDRDH